MQTKLPYSWTYSTLGECLIYEQPTKYIVKNTKYSNEYETPVLTAGKSFILGYTDDIENIFTQTPVIIFDDFTTDSKFVDFHFKVKSSAMKILHATEIANIKFVFYFMQTIQYRSDTHKRYWISEYAKLPIPLPPLETQQKIVAKLESEFAKIESTKSHLEKVKETIPRLKNSLLKSAFSGKLTQPCRDEKGVPYRHCEDSSESEAIHNAESPLKDSIAESKAYKIVDCHELRCNSCNDESIAQAPNSTQAPNLGGATLVAQNPQNTTNPPNCHLEYSEETHKESTCHSERSEESKSHFVNAQYEKDSNLPQGWDIKTLREVSKINPKNKLDDDLEVSFIPMNLIADKYQNKFSYTIKAWKEVKKGYTHLQNNCIAIAKITPCFENGKCVILQDLKNGYGVGTTELIVVLPNENVILLKFIFYFFNTAKFTKEGVKNFKGTAGQLRVSSDFISNLPIPLPPLETQKQIVEILDSKFAVLENLERETNASLEKLQRFKSSLLNLALKGELIC